MNYIALGQLIWFSAGMVIGAMVCIGLFLRFAPTPKEKAPQPIQVTPQISVDWALINAALKGAGMTAVYTEDAPKIH